ncbi:MAG: hypothetical protein RMK65_09770 [Anaerolineae bacterium]|nr:hypothetical protein [Anaerolineae bacterium]MCX8067340.1 hypothetical protein [Anaerolineae bacterium]MDW7992395.1 hypothetical protein [Anaerolineae bacterium]
MNCEEALNGMMEVLNAEALPDAQPLLLEHLRTCRVCRSRWERLQRVERVLRTAPLVSPAPGLTSRVLARLERHRRRQRILGGLAFAIGLGTFLLLTVLPFLGILPGLPGALRIALRTGEVLGDRLISGFGSFLNSLCLSATAFLTLILPLLLCGIVLGLGLVAIWLSLVCRFYPIRRSV